MPPSSLSRERRCILIWDLSSSVAPGTSNVPCLGLVLISAKPNGEIASMIREKIFSLVSRSTFPPGPIPNTEEFSSWTERAIVRPPDFLVLILNQ